MKNYYYKSFGLIIKSDLVLPELYSVGNSNPDIEIKYGVVPKQIDNPIFKGVLFESSPSQFLLRIENIGQFYAQDGKIIVVQPEHGVFPEEIRLFLLGSCIGILIHQRGSLPLHGSTVIINNYALLIAGNSASGKSSLAAGFSEKGYQILSDDLTVLESKSGNFMEAQPGIAHIKLWKDVLEYFNFDHKTVRVRPKLEKFRVFTNSPTPYQSYPLKTIVILEVSNSEQFILEEITGYMKFNLLRDNTFRIQLIDSLNCAERHFELVSELSKNIKLFRIKRPSYPLLIRELVSFIEEHIIANE